MIQLLFLLFYLTGFAIFLKALFHEELGASSSMTSHKDKDKLA